MNTIQRINPQVCGSTRELRQMRLFRSHYGTAARLHAVMCQRGIRARETSNELVSDDTAQRLMNGQRPGFFVFEQMVENGFGALWRRILGPAMMAGDKSELEARLEQGRAAIRAQEQELARVDAALRGETDFLEG